MKKGLDLPWKPSVANEAAMCTLVQGDVISRYAIASELDDGHFSKVYAARRLAEAETCDASKRGKRQEEVAIKVVRSGETYTQQGEDEIEFLRHARRCGCRYILRILDNFKIKKRGNVHLCIVMEKMQSTLFDFIERRSAVLWEIKDIARSILRGLGELRGLEIIHTDLKPENILLSRIPAPSAYRSKAPAREKYIVKIGDLGNSCYRGGHFTDYIQTLPYRSPETILSLPYDCSTDVWSFGCIVYEMVTGENLFSPMAKRKHRRGAPGENPYEFTEEEDHLALMAETLGPPPLEYIKQSKHFDRLFESTGELRSIKDLAAVGLRRLLKQRTNARASDVAEIADFLESALVYIPEKRPTPEELLRHKWLVGG